MAFLNPFFLYLLPLAGIPILIHLIGRRRFHDQEFSSLRFLKQLEVDLIRKLKIRQLLLLILRVLLIIILLLAFARPYRAAQTPGIYIARGQTLYLVIDNSLSMQSKSRGKTILEKGRIILETAADQIDFPIYLKLIETVDYRRIQNFGLINDRVKFMNAIGKVQKTNQGGHIDFALQAIFLDQKTTGELSPVIWIVSDFQESDWQRNLYAIHPVDSLLKYTDSRLIAFPVQPSFENVALSSLALPEQIIRANQPVQVRGFIRNWTVLAREIPVILQLGEQKLGQALLTVLSKGENNIQFEFIPSSPEQYKGILSIPDDDLIADNQRYFSVNVPDKIRVLILARHPEDGEHIKRSIGVTELSVIEAEQCSPSLFPTEDLYGYDLLIFSNIDRLSDNMIRKLHFYFESGKGILVFPGKDCEPAQFNRLWNREFGFPKWRTTQRAQARQYLKMGELQIAHPVFRRLLRTDEVIDYSPEFYVAPGFSTGRNHQVLATFEDQTPLLIETRIHGSKGLLMATAPVAAWSNLTLSGFFPAIMNRLVFYLSQPGYGDKQYSTGDTLRIGPFAADLGEDIDIRTAENRSFKLLPGAAGTILFDETNQPGFYDVYSKGILVERFVVNVPESESSEKFLSARDFRKLIDRHIGKVDVFFSNGNNDMSQLTQNREFSNWLIIVVLIVALLESYLGRANRKLQDRKKAHA